MEPPAALSSQPPACGPTTVPSTPGAPLPSSTCRGICALLFAGVILPPLVFTALKIKVKEITYINRDTKIILETKSKTIYKLNGVSERDLKKSVLWLKDSLQCTCEEMNDINAPYLVMGQKLGGELVITSVKRWQKGQREFKRISRSIRKLQC